MSMILADIGEVGVHAGERTCVLRPSLYAMSLLGTPRDIVATFANVQGPDAAGTAGHAVQRRNALAALYACAADEDLELLHGLFGTWDEMGHFLAGREPWPVALAIARCLLKHGVIGALPPLPQRADKQPEYSEKFDAREYVALAMAHLGLRERDAWEMTMTGLLGALRAKFPPERSPGASAPTVDEHEATMAWFERVEAARAKKQGAH